MKRFSLLITLISLTSVNMFSQKAASIRLSTDKEIKADIGLVPCKNKNRLEGVRKLFISKGAKESDIQIDDFKYVKNLVVEKKGKTDETVIIGAHWDEAGGGCGAIDNWSGIVIIANLYRTIQKLNTSKNYKFVAFGREEDGLIGSKAMAKAIPKADRERYCAMVNLDSFGQANPQMMRRISNTKLLKLAMDTAKKLKMRTAKAAIQGASSDSASFQAKKIPAISIHGLSNNWQSYLHTSRDQVKNVNHVSVYYGYRFALSLLVAIEARPCDAFRKKKKLKP